MSNPVSSLLAALAFLTWIPAWLPGARLGRKSQRDISNSRSWFPLVGLLIGFLVLMAAFWASWVFPIYLTAAVLLFVLSVVTRGLHLDGLMDVCDGIFGGATPERRLEIMKDPRVGAFGAAGLGVILVLKFGALLSLMDQRFVFDSGPVALLRPMTQGLDIQAIIVLLIFPMLSRWAMVASLAAFPYARSDGLGSPFHQGGILFSTAAAAVITLALSVLLGGLGGLFMFAGATVLALAMGWAMARSLGGLTGDCYGATNEVCEVAVMAAGLALARHGWLETFDEMLQRF